MSRAWLLAVVAALAAASGFASADDVADLRARYQQVRARLHTLGYSEPNRIAEVIAPRFIQYTDWDPRKVDPRVAYDPWLVYCPAPTTWQSWEMGNALVARMASWENVQGSPLPLELSWLNEVWETTMIGLQNPGMRKHGATGPQWMRAWALTDRQVEALQDLPGDDVVSWTGIKCFEDLDEKTRAQYANNPFHPELRLSVFPKSKKKFKDAYGVRRQCGYVEYTRPERLLTELHAMIQSWNEWGSAIREEPFAAAARFQRWLVAIHPYANGNGRLSRFLMDRIVMAAGLPAPLLADMNQDLFTSEGEWAWAIRDGVARAIEEMERCAAKPSALGCQEVRKTQPKTIPEGVCKKEF